MPGISQQHLPSLSGPHIRRDFDFHARYLLTDQAGLRYDRGFIEPSDHDERAKLTDVVCLERGTIKDLLTQHNVDDSTGAIVDVIEVV